MHMRGSSVIVRVVMIVSIMAVVMPAGCNCGILREAVADLDAMQVRLHGLAIAHF